MTIKLRRDTAANWASVNPVLASGQPGWDTTNEELRIGDGVSTWSALTPIGGGGGVTDGNKGDVVVSSGGTVWTLDSTTSASLRDRSTHTGTQGAATITGLATIATSGSAADLTGTKTSSFISDFTEASQDAVGAMVDASLTYVDATPTLQRAALTGAVTAPAGSNTTSLGSFTIAQLNTAISDADVSTTTHTHTLSNISDVTMTVANLNSLDDGVDSTLHFHTSDRNRANHTGTQSAATITGLASVATSGSASDLSTGTLPATRMPAHTGDVTSTAGSVALTISTDAVTNVKLANMAANTLKGNNTGSVTDPADLTVAQVKSLLAYTASDVGAQPLDADLTALAALSGTNTIYYRSAADTWSAVTIGTNLSFSGGTLSASGGGGGGASPILSWMI